MTARSFPTINMSSRWSERLSASVVAAVAVVIAVLVGTSALGGAPTQPRSTDVQASVAYADAASPPDLAEPAAPGPAIGAAPIRVFVTLPLPTEGGLSIYRGYVENRNRSDLTNVRMELTFLDGSTATYPIAAGLAPGARVTFEFRPTRTDVSGQPKFRFYMTH